MLNARFIKNTFITVIALAAFMAIDSVAYAQEGVGSGVSFKGAQTLGGVIKNSYKSLDGIPGIISVIAYIFGLLLAFKSMLDFKNHVDNSSQVPLSEGVKKFLAAGCLFSLPFISKVVVGSIFGESKAGIKYGMTHDPLKDVEGSLGMDRMIYNFVADIYGPMTDLLAVFSYITAIIFLVVGISRMLKADKDGPQGPTGMGTIATFLVAGVLFSLGGMMGTFNSTLFGGGNPAVSTYAVISETVISNVDDKQRIESVVESLMAFIMLVGYIAFIRGWLVLRGVANEVNGASVTQALTFLIGGTLAINLGELVNVLQRTVGLNPEMALTFH